MINWEAVSALGQLAGAIGTLAAVFIALFNPSIRKPGFKFSFSPDNNYSAVLIIDNNKSQTILLNRIEFFVDGDLLGIKILINEEYWLGRAEIFAVAPGTVGKIEFSAWELYCGEGHTICGLNEKNRSKRVTIRITDMQNKRYSYATKYSYEEFIKTVYEKLEFENTNKSDNI